MGVSIEDIKKLKELSGIGLTDAKLALVEANGDFDKALEALRKKGVTKAEKKAIAKPAKALSTVTFTAAESACWSKLTVKLTLSPELTDSNYLFTKLHCKSHQWRQYTSVRKSIFQRKN